MYAPAIITAPYARLSTSVTPNCSVKPIAATASTEAVTSPKPSEARKMVIQLVPSSRHCPQLGRGQVADDVHLAVGAVGIDLEDAGRVVVAVEAGRAARSLVPDRLARAEQGGAGREGVADRRAGRAVADREHVRPVHAGVGGLGHHHRE